MFDPTESMMSIQQEINKNLKQLSECKDLDECVKRSQIIKNLSDSVGVYLSFAADMAASFGEEGFEDEFGLHDDDI